jgi:hypothetical protein
VWVVCHARPAITRCAIYRVNDASLGGVVQQGLDFVVELMDSRRTGRCVASWRRLRQPLFNGDGDFWSECMMFSLGSAGLDEWSCFAIRVTRWCLRYLANGILFVFLGHKVLMAFSSPIGRFVGVADVFNSFNVCSYKFYIEWNLNKCCMGRFDAQRSEISTYLSKKHRVVCDATRWTYHLMKTIMYNLSCLWLIELYR